MRLDSGVGSSTISLGISESDFLSGTSSMLGFVMDRSEAGDNSASDLELERPLWSSVAAWLKETKSLK